MGKHINLFFIINIIFISSLFYKTVLPQDSVIVCNDYQSFENAVYSGKPASLEKTALLNEYSLIEKSLITILPNTPPENKFRIDIKILDISENIYAAKYDVNSILGFLFKDCEKFKSEYKNLINMSCTLIADSVGDALSVTREGIPKSVFEKYDVEGDIIHEYSVMCGVIRPKPVKKPAVYLYPEKDMNIKVTVVINGKLTKSEPEYNSGWEVFSTKESIINNKYDYLFYEADLNKIELPDEGWVVKYENLENWFNKYLPELGLNEKETSQFKEFWMKDLKEASFYEIRLLDNNFLNNNMKLVISPKPQTLIRLNFYFRPVIQKSELKEPVIVKTNRKGFTVVEWGGINESDLNIIP